jgi:predicted secreted protein
LFSALLLACLAVPCSAADWQKTFTVTGMPTLRVETNDASVHITGSDTHEVQVRVTTSGYRSDDVRISERQSGNRIEVEVRLAHRPVIGFSVRSAEIDVALPHESDLDIYTGDGRIEVMDVKGNARLASNDGRIRVYRADGSLNASTGDGSIEADGRFDALDVTTHDGHVRVSAQAGSKIGGIGWSVHTKDGRVDVLLPDKFAADLDAETHDGHVTVDIPLETSGQLGHSRVRGKLNGGGPALRIRTGDGSIHIGRS